MNFQTLKTALCSDAVLAFPNFKGEFIVQTDASNFAIGAIIHNEDGRPVHYARSRVLKDSELRYSVVEKELLAIVFSTRVFWHYLLGKTFEIRTKVFLENWVLLFGIPEVIIHDQGTEFEGSFKMLLEALKCENLKLVAYHHETIGALENSYNSYKENI